MRIVFLCKGSRGDVLPVFSLLLGYKKLNPTDSCVLATHALHKEKFLGLANKHGVEFVSLDDQNDTSEALNSLQRTELQVSSGRGFSNSERQDRVLEMHASLHACRGAGAIVFNLFACEGWFIAEYLKVPCIAVSPFAVTRTPPVTFESKFVDAYPDLYERLRNAPEGCVSYGDVDHWMWRLYLDDFGEFCESLGLPVCPMAEVHPSDKLPLATPLLYGISPSILEKPGYWPDSVSMCGYWFLDSPKEDYRDIEVLQPTLLSPKVSLEDFFQTMAEAKESPLYIGFGSMEELGFFSSLDCVELVGIINEGLVECNIKALLHVSPNSSLLKAWEMVRKNVLYCNIYCVTQYTPHAQLFPKCLAVMHHGGSGTVASAIRASVPQIVCPFMFDQSYWADKVAWMGVGESLGHPRSITVTSFTDALRSALQDDVFLSVSNYSEILRKEDGVKEGASILSKALRS
ncbi:sterol 3-beta-glucosyltransferase UGT80B1 [Nematostella vectensis]|uniref:sterol 3-beta-glucosyltransferase UGT80B1 n=1 Tax=Nematostella vectensis TaxID=45351 RepID=UPI001390544A|nr:sterol 3-beta-glucosyltransferase UGT80B1 [Nematostella vectensis]